MRIFKILFGTTASKVWLWTTVGILTLFLVINILVTQNLFLYNSVNSVLGGERRVLVEGDPSKYIRYKSDYDTKAETLAAANALNEKIVEEGITLLKNEDNTLPLKTSKSDSTITQNPKISIFGHNSVSLVYGGSGSGGASSEGASTIYESMTGGGGVLS